MLTFLISCLAEVNKNFRVILTHIHIKINRLYPCEFQKAIFFIASVSNVHIYSKINRVVEENFSETVDQTTWNFHLTFLFIFLYICQTTNEEI